MKKNRILYILLVIILILIISLVIFVFLNQKNVFDKPTNENRLETVNYTEIKFFENMNTDKYELNSYTFTNVILTKYDEYSMFYYDFTNNGDSIINPLNIKVTLFDKDNNLLYSFDDKIENVKNGETVFLYFELKEDLSNAYSFKIEEVKED